VVAFTWMFYLVLTDERRILIDTGFVDRAYVARYGIRHYRAPDQLLDQLGFPPATITDVVLTHGHFDHAGGIVRYPEATLYLQRATAKHIGQDANLGAARRHLVQAEKEGRLHWVGQSYHLTDELVIQHVGGHTQGSQVVVLSHDDRRYLFVGDECYLREACLAGQPLPPRVATNGVRNQAFVERMAKEAQTGRGVLLTFHDPVILSEHPALAPGVVQIR